MGFNCTNTSQNGHKTNGVAAVEKKQVSMFPATVGACPKMVNIFSDCLFVAFLILMYFFSASLFCLDNFVHIFGHFLYIFLFIYFDNDERNVGFEF